MNILDINIVKSMGLTLRDNGIYRSNIENVSYCRYITALDEKVIYKNYMSGYDYIPLCISTHFVDVIEYTPGLIRLLFAKYQTFNPIGMIVKDKILILEDSTDGFFSIVEVHSVRDPYWKELIKLNTKRGYC